jgi:hypothetical protein
MGWEAPYPEEPRSSSTQRREGPWFDRDLDELT